MRCSHKFRSILRSQKRENQYFKTYLFFENYLYVTIILYTTKYVLVYRSSLVRLHSWKMGLNTVTGNTPCIYIKVYTSAVPTYGLIGVERACVRYCCVNVWYPISAVVVSNFIFIFALIFSHLARFSLSLSLSPYKYIFLPSRDWYLSATASDRWRNNNDSAQKWKCYYTSKQRIYRRQAKMNINLYYIFMYSWSQVLNIDSTIVNIVLLILYTVNLSNYLVKISMNRFIQL